MIRNPPVDPKPGLVRLGADPDHGADVYVRPVPTAGCAVELNSDTSAARAVNQVYYTDPSKMTVDGRQVRYHRLPAERATRLVRALIARAI
jgi:hypothetical protein